MKKYLFILMTALLIGFTSCSNDDNEGGDEPNIENVNYLVGTWQSYRFECVNANGQLEDYEDRSGEDVIYITFGADGKGVTSDFCDGHMEQHTFTYAIINGNSMMIQNNSDDLASGLCQFEFKDNYNTLILKEPCESGNGGTDINYCRRVASINNNNGSAVFGGGI